MKIQSGQMGLRTERGVYWSNQELGFSETKLYPSNYVFHSQPQEVTLHNGTKGYVVGYTPSPDPALQKERLLFVPQGTQQILSISKHNFE